MAKSSRTSKKKLAPAEGESTGGYTVLARRYRSRDFDEIVGQEPIARTLTNAIANNRIAHAYLFCGTRGVGKTSMARIFAKAINVTPDLKEADRIGKAILRGEDLDVIEIDAASNRGISEVKDVLANAIISPARSPYKIYIIDEVHMLTREAFNALLKTMEEPPSHVKFILCTTDPHKVPATIQSRCQRFDFRPLSATQIAQQLRDVLAAEGIEAEDEAVAHMARLGNGSMRDALSLMDRVLAIGEKKITFTMLEEMLGLPDRDLISKVVDAIAAADARSGLEAADALLRAGITVEQALEALAEHLRTLMIVSLCGADSQLLELSEVPIDRAKEQAQHFDGPALVHAIALCDSASRSAARSAAGRAMFDAVVVRLCMSEHIADIATLLEAGEGKPTGSSTVELKKKDPPVVEVRPQAAANGHSTHVAPKAAPRPEAPIARAPAPQPTSSGNQRSEDKLETALRIPAVAMTMSLFRGHIVEVQPVEGETASPAPEPAAFSVSTDDDVSTDELLDGFAFEREEEQFDV